MTGGLDRAAVAAAVAAQGRVARVLILAHAGSTPREAGTAMLVWDGGQQGTIGGGALEHEAARRARALLAEPGPWRRARIAQPLGPALGQCCGGSVTLLIEAFGPQELAAIPERGVFRRPSASGGAPGPQGEVAEPVGAPAAPLWLYGAGHVGRALVGVLAGLDWRVTWVDDARDRFPDAIPAHADMLVAADPARAVALAPGDAHHLVMTYSHALDLDICHAVLSRDFASLGLIGSATKRARFLRRLADLGHPPGRLARLTCPIGDPSLGKEPQAIAVGVVHRLLRERRAAEEPATSNGDTAA
jgi:xanthine dehydrogenase accessory factor